LTRLPEGISIVDGFVLSRNHISKTALGRTYRSYLKHEVLKRTWGNRIVSDEEYHNAWCDSRWDRCKRILGRLYKRFTNKLKSYKIIIKK